MSNYCYAHGVLIYLLGDLGIIIDENNSYLITSVIKYLFLILRNQYNMYLGD